MTGKPLNLLFIINPGAGNNKTDWKKEITGYFSEKPHNIELFELPETCEPGLVKEKIKSAAPDRVIAVGGDGTLKLVADLLTGTDTTIGLLPAGSANGMAKELDIPADPAGALDVILSGQLKKIHLTRINNERCIHLSDIGFNAFVIKTFEDEGVRGMWGYIKAAWKVLWNYNHMNVKIKIDDEYIQREAAMVVIANATKYGTGVLINPEGRLDDDRFEVIIIKKISFAEIFKMRFTHRPYHPGKTELFQTTLLEINSRHKVHFQVDGEYRGKLKSVIAEIIPGALTMLVPAEAGGKKSEV
jgi:diacylglycerol kinase (ATP)